MSKVAVSIELLDDLANSVSNKSGVAVPMSIAQMKTAVDSIDTSGGGYDGEGIIPTGTINITTNGTHDVTQYASANVNVPSQSPSLQSKTATPTESAQTITADSNYDGLSSVEVGAISSSYVGSGVTRQGATTITPTESEQNAVAANVYTTGVIKVSAISDTYVGSAIDQNDSTDLTVLGATVTGPSGYYAEGVSKSVASGSATTPATTITANPSIDVNASGLITATASASQSVTPTVSAGYVSSGTGGTITVSGSNTSQLATQAATTITPTESEQIAVATGKYTTGEVKVGAISSTYVGSGITQRDDTDLTASGATVTVPAGHYASQETKSIASGTEGTPTANKGTVSNHSISITPSVTNTAGYISGGTHSGTAATVSASELVSGTLSITDNNDTKDVTNYASVNVAIPFNTVYTGSSDPSSSAGTDGDIYIKVVS